MTAQQHRTQSRAESQRIQCRKHRRNRNRNRKLLIEPARNPADQHRRHKHRQQHQRRGDHRPSHLLHCLGRRRLGGEVFLGNQPRRVFHHDNRIVHHNPNDQHQPEQRQGIDGHPHSRHDRKRPDQRNRDHHRRNQRRPPVRQKDKHRQNHQSDHGQQGPGHLFEGFFDKQGRIVRNLVDNSLRKRFGHFRQHFANPSHHIQGVGLRRRINANGYRRYPVMFDIPEIVLGAQFHPRDVFDAQQPPFCLGANNNILKLFDGTEPTERFDGVLELLVGRAGHFPDLPGGDLDILLANRAQHIVRGQIARFQTRRVQPDAHPEILGPEHLHIADARHTRQGILDPQRDKVAQINPVILAARRQKADDHRKVRRLLLRLDTVAFDLFGQQRLGNCHAVLYQHGRHIHIRADLKCDRQLHNPVIAAAGGHIQHPVNAVDGLFQRRRDRLGQDLGVGAGIGRLHQHRRRRNVRRLFHRQQRQADQPDQNNHNRNDSRENGSVDKKLTEHNRLVSSYR